MPGSLLSNPPDAWVPSLCHPGRLGPFFLTPRTPGSLPWATPGRLGSSTRTPGSFPGRLGPLFVSHPPNSWVPPELLGPWGTPGSPDVPSPRYRRCDKIEARKLERLAQRGRCPPRVTPWDSEDSGDSGDMGGDTGGDPGGAEPPRRSGRRLLRPRPRAPPTATPTATPTEPDSAGTATDERPLEDPEEPPRPRRPLQPLLQLRARRRMGDWAPPGSPRAAGGGGAAPATATTDCGWISRRTRP
ncbi:histone-lysine N-methyltransferase 2B-like [Columba livia]|uniref:histone-lysine N-methyltransferase 2B-like n=1 Tax=Columba livia TaxID=8932 RepID=UPI0031BABEFD